MIWAVIAGTGAATFVSYSIIAEYFPKEISGQANSALNTLHISGAFVIQSTIGIIVSLWSGNGGHYPAIAYEVAIGANVAIQIMALSWFFVPVGIPLSSAGPAATVR